MFDESRFGEKLKQCRRERGLTQTELAERLAVTAQSVSKWERGESLPDVARLAELAGIFRVSADTLLYENRTTERTFIAVDCGLRTEFVLFSERGRVLQSVTLGECKPKKLGMETARGVIRQGVALLRPDGMNVQGLFLRGGSFDGEELRLLLEREYPNLRVGCDRGVLSLMEHSSQPDRCLVVTSGGSCVVCGRDDEGLVRTGGAGYLFQRSGSAYDIGRDALSAALAERDGTGEPTELTRMVEDVLGGPVWDSLDRFYLEDPTYVIGFAPLVARACRRGDRVARQILEHNSEHLALLIGAARNKTPHACCVLLSGSVFTTDDTYYDMLVRRLDPALRVERLLWPPIWNACLQCVRMCGLTPMPSLDLFMKTRKKTN